MTFLFSLFSEFVSVDNVKSYSKHRSIYANGCKSCDFVEAVRICENYFRGRSISPSNETINSNDIKATESKPPDETFVHNENKRTHCQLCADKDSRINELTREKEKLAARITQLESNLIKTPLKQKRGRKSNASEQRKEYEVECIIKDKIVKGTRKFLVRWKDYDSDDDTWESESKLKRGIPDILNAYLSTKRSKRNLK